MDKAKSSGLVKFMNIIGVIMFVVFIYMMIANVIYLRTYAASYAMSIGDMWQDMLQYVISGSLEYFVYGVLLIASGKIINMLQNCCQGAELQKVESGAKIKAIFENSAAESVEVEFSDGEDSEGREAEQSKSPDDSCDEADVKDDKESSSAESFESQTESGEVIEVNVSEDATEETKAINVSEIRQRKRKNKK